MKELEWIKELDENFKSGDKERFPIRAHITYWENITVDDEHRQMMKDFNKLSIRLIKEMDDYAEMRHLGEYYLVGCSMLKLPVNYKKAIYWYSRAAQYKCAYRGEVLYRLAYYYKYARGANKDTEKAFKMLEALAAIDCSKIELPERAEFTADANICLADCYCRGIGTEKNNEKALAIWEKYANESDGDIVAKNNLKRLKKKGIIADDENN